MSITLGQLVTRYRQAARSVDDTADRKLRTIAVLGVGHMKRAIQRHRAVDLGTMLNSTTYDQAGDTYLIGPTVTYAPYVALGTSRMAARPFHLDAARAIRSDVRDILSADELGI